MALSADILSASVADGYGVRAVAKSRSGSGIKDILPAEKSDAES